MIVYFFCKVFNSLTKNSSNYYWVVKKTYCYCNKITHTTIYDFGRTAHRISHVADHFFNGVGIGIRHIPSSKYRKQLALKNTVVMKWG